MDHVVAIIIMALVAQGAFVAMGEGMVLSGFNSLSKRIPEPWRHPVSSCPRCMVSLWGTLALLALGMLPSPLWLLPVYWLSSAGLQELLER